MLRVDFAELRISDSKFRTQDPNFKSQIPNFKFRISNLKFQISNLKFQIPAVRAGPFLRPVPSETKSPHGLPSGLASRGGVWYPVSTPRCAALRAESGTPVTASAARYSATARSRSSSTSYILPR